MELALDVPSECWPEDKVAFWSESILMFILGLAVFGLHWVRRSHRAKITLRKDLQDMDILPSPLTSSTGHSRCDETLAQEAGDEPSASALESAEEMKRAASHDVESYNRILREVSVTADLRRANEIVAVMKRRGIKPNHVTYKHLMRTAGSSGNLRKVWKALDMMERDGLSLDRYMACDILKWLRDSKRASDMHLAFACLDRARLNILADDVLLRAVLETCLHHKDVQRLSDIVSKAESWPNLMPSLPTYAGLIKASGVTQRMSSCWGFWDHLTRRSDLEANNVVLGCMLNALVRNGFTDQAVSLFRSWKGRIEGNAVIYATLIKGFKEAHQPRRALEMRKEMRLDGVKLNTVVYNSLLDCQAQSGAIEGMKEIVAAMVEDGCDLDVVTYALIIKCYCVAKNLDMALRVFRQAQQTVPNDSSIYNLLLDSCLKQDRMDLAVQIKNDLEKYEVIPSQITLGFLIKLYSKRNELDAAFEIVTTCEQRFGIKPDARVWKDLVLACAKANDIWRAQKAFDALHSRGFKAEIRAWSCLVSCYIRIGDPETALRLVRQAYGLEGQRLLSHDQVFDAELLEKLVSSLRRRNTEGLSDSLEEQLFGIGMPLCEHPSRSFRVSS
eukprot:CAMPEP_0170628952 /NCGR_PEP_ID=MMETSP0224-20130122/33023_1 /TAXON_ID=285029 /ORGANISM="Togula jolla, Strain CCCM 725" /LENGTH=614 /DNA_ID=CAMNT_0010956541 /DNA_START=8 /DNA_END=1852 /DNA_ORIENTATION=+